MDRKLFIKLFLSFVAFTIIGTLSHEFGHYIVAKCLGYNARINYSSTIYSSDDPYHLLTPEQSTMLTMGGPIQTMLTGIVGLCLLFIFRKGFYQANELSFGQWLIIFVSLFWLRQPANFFVWMGRYFLNGEMSTWGDEIELAFDLDLPALSIILTTALIGVFILALITFKFIPSIQRITFLAAGLSGGITGYIFWLILFGKYIMP